MKRNVGPTDTALRIVVGVILLAAIAFVEGPLRWLGLIGVVPLQWRKRPHKPCCALRTA